MLSLSRDRQRVFNVSDLLKGPSPARPRPSGACELKDARISFTDSSVAETPLVTELYRHRSLPEPADARPELRLQALRHADVGLAQGAGLFGGQPALAAPGTGPSPPTITGRDEAPAPWTPPTSGPTTAATCRLRASPANSALGRALQGAPRRLQAQGGAHWLPGCASTTRRSSTRGSPPKQVKGSFELELTERDLDITGDQAERGRPQRAGELPALRPPRRRPAHHRQGDHQPLRPAQFPPVHPLRHHRQGHRGLHRAEDRRRGSTAWTRGGWTAG